MVALSAVLLSLAAILPFQTPQIDTVVIPDQVSCSLCVLSLDLKLTLGRDDGPELLYDRMAENVFRADDGAYWVHSYDFPAQMIRFTEGGKARIIERRGQGPDEFLRIMRAFNLPGQGIGIIDLGNMRIVRLSYTGAHLGSVPYSGPTQYMGNVVPLKDGELLIAAVGGVSTPVAGVPIHKVNRMGDVVASLGESPPTLNLVGMVLQGRRLAVGDGEMYSAHVYQYLVEQRDLESGALKAAYVRDAIWFRPGDIMAVNPPLTDPASYLVDVAALDDGRVMTLLRRPRTEWRQGYKVGGGEGRAGAVIDYALVWETVIELLDLDEGEVVSRVVEEGMPLSFVANGTEVALLDDRGDTPRIRIYSIKY